MGFLDALNTEVLQAVAAAEQLVRKRAQVKRGKIRATGKSVLRLDEYRAPSELFECWNRRTLPEFKAQMKRCSL
jgi:hypothetical protein